LVARAIHWFNPLVWLAERTMRVDQEMACDEWVLAHADDIDPQSYGRVLLQACRTLESPSVASPAHATMAESSAGLAQRIRHIVQMKSHGWRALAAGGLLGGILLAIGPSPIAAQFAPSANVASPEKTAVPPAAEAASSLPPSPAPPPAPASNRGAVANPPLIEIEAKLVELSGQALKDLQKSLPSAVDASGEMRIESMLEPDQLQPIIRSLNESKGVDFVSVPRATTRSGQRAIVEVGREFRYPSEMTPKNDGTGAVTPTAFETRKVGVTMEVIPAIEPGNHIDVQLNPSVVELVGFVNYGAARPPRITAKGDALTEMMKSPSTKHVINQPIFDTRRFSTSASINTGQTILVGGLSRTNTQKVEEETHGHKKKTYEQKIETYLFIFVTARIVS
jgi:hypothetical protein